MASAHISGEERLKYTPPGGTEVVHLLAVPLIIVRGVLPSRARRRYYFEAEDLINTRTVTTGGGVAEMVVTVRADNDAPGLTTLLRHALEDEALVTYQQTPAGTEYPFRIIEQPFDAPDFISVLPDRDTAHLREWEATFRARRIDGGTFDALLS